LVLSSVRLLGSWGSGLLFYDVDISQRVSDGKRKSDSRTCEEYGKHRKKYRGGFTSHQNLSWLIKMWKSPIFQKSPIFPFSIVIPSRRRHRSLRYPVYRHQMRIGSPESCPRVSRYHTVVPGQGVCERGVYYNIFEETPSWNRVHQCHDGILPRQLSNSLTCTQVLWFLSCPNTRFRP